MLFLFLTIQSTEKLMGQSSKPLSDVLRKTILEFIEIEDSICGQKGNNVINVDFYKDVNDGACYVRMVSSPLYYECCLMGYVIINRKMIAFYDWRSYCSTGFISRNNLQKKRPDGYVSFEQQNNIPPFESRYVKYKITGFNKLEFCKRGIM